MSWLFCVAISRQRGLMRSNVNSRGSRFWVNLRRYCLRRATDCAKPASGSVQLAEVGELAWRRFWPDMASVMWYWLEMSWESSCVCVCGNKAELSFSFSLWSAAVLRLPVICLRFVFWPRLHRGTVTLGVVS